jgi:cell division protein FtsZ
MADDVLYSGVRGVTDLMVMPGLINLDFADIRTVMGEMGKAMMGTGEAEGDKRAIDAAEAAIANPLLEDTSMKGAKGVLINITGGLDMTLFEVDEAANRIREEVDPDANIIFGSTFDESLKGRMRVSVVATGIASETAIQRPPRPELKVVAQRSLMAAAPTLAGIATAALAQPVTVGQVALAQAVLDPPAAAAEEPAVKPMPVSEIAIATPIAPAATAIPTPEVVERAVESPQAAIAVAIKPAPATATIPSAFVPPEPARATAKVEPHKADPFAEADMVNAPKERARPASLFERVTGIGRARPADPTPAKEPGPPKAPTLAVSRPPSTPQPRLNNLDPRDRVAPAYEDDLLDIPTFLRRQAN